MCSLVAFDEFANINRHTKHLQHPLLLPPRHPQHLYGSAGCPILTEWTNTPPSSTLSPQPSSLLRVKLSGDSRPCSFTSILLHLLWEGFCSLWMSSACLWEQALFCVFPSGLFLTCLLWTGLDVVAPLACGLLLAGEGGQIPKGVKERVRLLRFSSREEEPVGFAAGLTVSQVLGTETSHGIWRCCCFWLRVKWRLWSFSDREKCWFPLPSENKCLCRVLSVW